MTARRRHLASCLALVILFVATSTFAQAPAPPRIELPWGYIEYSNNEVVLVSTIDDPPKWRLASTTGSLGAVSWSILNPDGSLNELVLLQGKKDERTRHRSDVNYGEMTLHLKAPPRFPGDDGMILVGLFLHDYVWLRHLAIGGFANPPPIDLPPPVETVPPAPVCNTSERTRQLDRINSEFVPWGITIDGDAYAAYASCRHANLKEVHDDVVVRNNGDHDPSVHPIDAPY